MLKIIELNQNIINKAKDRIKQNELSDESIVARYEILKETDKLIEKDINNIPLFNDFYWSISHKKNIVFVWTSDKQIWIDIEILKERSKEIYNVHNNEEYKLLWGKNIENFYKLWTIKESIIKLNLSSIDYSKEINIEKITKNKHQIDSIDFNIKVLWTFKNTTFTTYCWIKDNLIYSISLFSLR